MTGSGNSACTPWDIAAGLLIVREAGGFATDPQGGDPRDHRRRGGRQPASARRLREAAANGLAAGEARAS